jgi:hypothetical protein
MEDKIKVGLQTGCDVVGWIHLAQDGDSCEPSGPIKGARFLE